MNDLNRKMKRTVPRLFGFQESRPDRYLNSPLDEAQIAAELAGMKADLNWIKRILWFIVCAGGAGFYFS